MKKIIWSAIAILTCGLMVAFTASEKTTYKFLIQMKNHEGPGAYVIVSLLNPEGEYDETLYVQGDDPEWYSDMDEWWKFHGKKRSNIDAITGATVSAGERKITSISIPTDKMNAGYTLRFETAVEDHDYYVSDIEIPATEEALRGKIDGEGYIRYVRFVQAK